VSEQAPAPSLRRRLASLLYEFILLFAVAFLGTWLFQFAAGSFNLLDWRLYLLRAFLLALFAAYFLWNWLRGGQTLPMKTWRIRLVDVTPRKAFLRFVYAVLFVPTGISIVWALFDRDRQFLHDRLAGTRLVSV
jgi:uncharacterized RDD family membrane protein YckC